MTDQATIAGGTVSIGPGSAIGGRTLIAAGNVVMAGQVGDSLRVAAGKAVISGQIAGDVEIAAREIRVESGAIIGGDLVWRSGQPPYIAEDAQVLGEVRAASSGEAQTIGEDSASRFDGGWAFGFTVVVAALILLWFAPELIARSAAVFSAAPVRTGLLGTASVVRTPVLAFVLFVTVLGWLVGLVVMAGYAFGLAVQPGRRADHRAASRNRLGATTAGWQGLVLLVLVGRADGGTRGAGSGRALHPADPRGFGALTALVTGRGPGRTPASS